jgi:hypothetical protein
MRSWQFGRRGASGLGVFAITLQLFLSFGHVHLPNVTTTPSSAVTTYCPAPVPSEQPTPSGLPDEGCPICMIMHMVSSGVLPSPPSTVAYFEFSLVHHCTFVTAINVGITRYSLFQTRAPPPIS